MSQEKKLVKKTIIYAIGNIGSKVLAYLMVLVYSHYITAEDLGYYDLILATVSMIQPIITFQISDGVYRFLVSGYEEEKKRIVSSVFKMLCIVAVISEIVYFIFAWILHLKYPVWVGLYLLAILFFFFFHEAMRGLGKSKEYAYIGIINSGVMLFVEVIGLIVFKLGILALIAGNVLSMFVCIFVMISSSSEFKKLFAIPFDKELLKKIFLYSIPLVPNTVCWWVVNSSDRYIILGFLGTKFNGIYSISNKFPTILTTITGIFYLAWQESAITEYDSPNRDDFFSNIFKKYYILLFSLCLCGIPFTHVVMWFFVGNEYKMAWIYTGALYLAAVFSALSSFLGLGYQISKETTRSVITTVIAAIINAVINLSMIGILGLHAASISTFIAYFFLFMVRVKHTKRYFTLNVNWHEFNILFISTIIATGTTIVFNNIVYSFVFGIFGIGITIVMNKELLLNIIKKVAVKKI